MKEKKIVVYCEKTNPTFVKTVVVKHEFPKIDEFLYLFNSVGWEREKKRVKENKKCSCFAVSLYVEGKIVGMGRVVGDGAYFTVFDIVVDKEFQGLGFGSIIMKEIVDWFKCFEDDDTFLYVNASKNKEAFYEKFGFRSRPNDELGAGMKWCGEE